MGTKKRIVRCPNCNQVVEVRITLTSLSILYRLVLLVKNVLAFQDNLKNTIH